MNHILLLIPPHYQSKKRIYLINIIGKINRKKKKEEFDTMMTLVGHDFFYNDLPKNMRKKIEG